MIARLRGRVLSREEQSIVVDVGGVGLEVYVPVPLAAGLSEGDEVHLYTHLHVRENELSLYGFAEPEERRLFRLLLNVSGIGPRVALSLLSAMSVTAIHRAIADEQPGLLSRVPGIGRKTAEKIVLELKDRIPELMAMPESAPGLHAVDADVIEALVGLGYSVVEAQRAVQGLPPDVTDVSERLRLALSRLAKQ